jgi:predicted CXXCH cytochrome family protein
LIACSPEHKVPLRAGAPASIATAVLALLAVSGRGSAAATPEGGPPCESCHKSLVKKKQVHPALEAISCTDCHEPGTGEGKCKSPLAKGWKLKSSEPGLCRDCHPQDEKKPKLHPVIDGMGCTPCHDAHASDAPHLLKTAAIGELCQTCHDGVAGLPHPHTPVKQGRCLDCHDPHGSAEPHLLKVRPADLCGTCHPPAKLLPQRYPHAPVTEGACTECHGVHGAKFAKNTLAEPNDLCTKCHDAKAAAGPQSPRGKMRIDLAKAKVHGALDAGGCVACHVPGHSSAMPKLLKQRPGQLCYECHDRQDGTAFVHSAVRLGDCAVCHEPHSSDAPHLLRKAGSADTCFLCHADDATGRAVVHPPLKQGKCDACHDAHGSAHEFSLTRGPGKVLCQGCHKPVDTGRNKHAVLERGGCMACHDPHATGHPFLLPKPVNVLCTSCHPGQKDGTHVTTFVHQGHKVSGGPDPHNIDRDFSCSSCHNPHGSDSPKLLRWGDKTMEVCDFCHGDRMGRHPELKDIRMRKRSDKNAAEYRKAVPSSLLDAPATKPAVRDGGAPDAAAAVPDARPASSD